MSIRTDAKTIGKKDAESSALAASIRKAWLKAKANPEERAEIARDFKIGYISGMSGIDGREKVSLADAEAIFDAGKAKGVPKAHIKMIDCATSGFNYHIVKGKAKAQAPSSSMRIQAPIRDAAMDFLAVFKGETLAEQIAQAIKVLQAMR